MEHPIDLLEHVTNCPNCEGKKFQRLISAKDHYYTEQEFTIVSCITCELAITSPRPKAEYLDAYYRSENYLSHGAKKNGLVPLLYGLIQKRNMRFKCQSLKQHVPRGTWCDYGAGDGSFVRYITAKKLEAIGFEPSTQARDAAAAKQTTLLDPIHFSDSKNKFACITLWHVLEHIPNLIEVIQILKSKLLPDGVICVAVPNLTSYDYKVYSANWAALDVPRHLWHFKPKTIESLFRAQNMECSASFGLPFDSYYISILSEKYKGGNIFKGLLTGIKSNLMAKKTTQSYSSQVYIFKKRI